MKRDFSKDLGRDFGIGVIIIGSAILALMGWGLRGFFADADVHLGLKVAMGVIGGGVLFLVVKLTKDRLTRAKKDKAGEVEK